MTVKTRMTAAEFLALPETNRMRELIEGEVVMNPPKDPHQSIMLAAIRYLLMVAISGRFRFAPTGLILDDLNILEPDIFWLSADNTRCTLGGDQYWHGAPDLVVEVLSPSSVRYDRVVKFGLHEKYGVREYWVIDPELPSVQVWSWTDGKFAYRGVYTSDKTFTSPVLDAAIDVKKLLTE